MKLFYDFILNTKKSLTPEEKGSLLLKYLHNESAENKLFALELIMEKKNRRYVNPLILKEWLLEVCNLPEWLIEKCIEVSGDLAETISLLTNPNNEKRINLSLVEMGKMIEMINTKDKMGLFNHFKFIWNNCSKETVFVFVKMLLGGFNFAIPNTILLHELSKYTQLSIAHLAQKLASPFDGLGIDFDQFISNFDPKKNKNLPYPFPLYQNLEEPIFQTKLDEKWLVEKVWNKERMQLIVRENALYFWTEKNELISKYYPEFEHLKNTIPNDTAIIGWLVEYIKDKNFQAPIINENSFKREIKKSIFHKRNIVFYANDIIENKGIDIRNIPYLERKNILINIISCQNEDLLRVNTTYEIKDELQWKDLNNKFKNDFYEGFFIRKMEFEMANLNIEDKLFFWKKPPLEINVVLLYATKGNGKSTNEFIDFTFGIRDNEALVPISKAINNLDEHTQIELEQIIANNTKEKFGPIRSVVPSQLFKLSFTAVLPSKRHKSGVVLKFPKIMKWLKNQPLELISTLSEINALIN